MTREPLDIETAFRSAYEQREPFPSRPSRASIIIPLFGGVVLGVGAIGWVLAKMGGWL